MNDKKAPPANTDAWITETPGDSLVGEVVDVDTAWSNWRARQNPSDPDTGWYPLLSIRTDDGEIKKLHGFRTVLFNELVKRAPKPGERITVLYRGKGESKGDGNPPELYSVTVERDPEAAKVHADGIYKNLGHGRRVGFTPDEAAPESDVPADTEGLPI